MCKKYCVIALLFLIPLFLLATCFGADSEPESFVIKKKKKSKSKSKAQKEACQVFAQQLSDVPTIHKKIAEIQELLLKETGKYLENAKDGFLIKAKKDRLAEAIKRAEDFEQKMEAFSYACDQYLEYLNSL